MRSGISIAAALAALGSIPSQEIDPNSLRLPMPNLGPFPFKEPRPTYRGTSDGTLARNRANNLANLAAARAATAKHKGNPPGYTYAHHDFLVRLYGRRKADWLEGLILERRATFAQAIAPNSYETSSGSTPNQE